MKRIVSFLVASLMMVGSLQAAKVSVETAAIVARNFMDCQGIKASLTLVDCGLTEMYLFSASDGGIVLVAGDDCVHPILGYSLTASAIAPLPENMVDWVNGYAEEIVWLREQRVEPSPQVRSEWSAWLKSDGQRPLYSVVVAPMITTTWKQGSPYNTQCPHDTLDRDTKSGCVAIAMAQVMKYWNHPTQGVGSYSYTTANCGTISANFGATTYDWANMPNSLTSVSPTVNIDAVAELVYHAGVSVKMTYRHSSSSATTTSDNNLSTITGERALRTFFKYDKALHSVQRNIVGDSVFTALLEEELLAGRPVIFSGHDTSGGHAFICDGRNNAGLYHFNWGWGGYCDGYYQIGALNPAPGGDGGNATSHYNLENRMIIGIQPDTVTAGTYTLTASPDDTSHGSVTGGGSYAYGDTVVLTAMASSSYRFARWDDGMCYNFRNLIMGGDRTVTAIYDSVCGDTLRYDNDFYLTSWGYNTARPYYWAMKLEPALLTGHTYLAAVQAYFKEGGTYRVFVCNDTVPGHSTMLDSLSYVSTEEGWATLPFDGALAVDTSLPLWIILYNDDINHPACAGTYCGHQMAAYRNTDGTSWDISTKQRTFLIRGIFSATVPPEPPAPVFDTTVAEACGSYDWEDSTYIESGIYGRMFTASTGGDSLRVLVLTVYPEYHLFDTVTAIDSFLWVNNHVYAESGVYTFDTMTVHGCDSALTLVLTITPSQGIEDVTENSIVLYPVPTSGMLYFGTEVEKVEVYDAKGCRVFAAGRTCEIDLSPLPVGTYVVRILQPGGGVSLHRIAKQ